MEAQNETNNIELFLWENGYPNSNGTEQLEPDEKKGIYKPSIRVFLPKKEMATGRAVIICPGGGYSHLAYHHEGYDFAPFFNKLGIAAIVLKYRMPKGGNYEVPLSDAIEAIRLVKQHANGWNINPEDIGIMGSSAGGHLASTVATHAEQDRMPAFQVLLYPVITMDTSYTHKGSANNLLGKNPEEQLVISFSNEKQVKENTPRAFIVLSNDDKAVVPANGVGYYLALQKQGIPASLHIYPTGGHGWGIRENFQYKELFLTELKEWLRSF